MLKVYVAASSAREEATRAARMIERLRAAGIHVVYDWPSMVLCSPRGDARSAPQHRDVKVALAELAAVREADVVWLLVPPSGSLGAGFEVGLAYSDPGKLVVCSGPHVGSFHFGVLFTEYDTDDAALALLERTAKRAPA